MSTNPDVCVGSAETAPATRNGLSFPFGVKRADTEPMDLMSGIQWLQVPLSSSMATVNCWALRDGDGWAVVDVGMHLPMAEARWQALTAQDGPLGGAPTRVIATHMHADHMGMAGELFRQHG